MAPGEYVVGAAGSLLALGALVAGARRLRHRWLPTWHGAPAWVFEVVTAMALLVAVGLVLGSFGALTPGAAFAMCLGASLLALALGAPEPPGSIRLGDRPRLSAMKQPDVLVAVAVTAAVAAQWASATVAAFHHGMLSIDTAWYHGPLAARFVQEGSITDLLLSNPGAIIPFYPANSELLGALAILPSAPTC